MEKVESALDVLSRAATMLQQPCPSYIASDSEGFETPSTGSSGESEGDRTLSPEAPRTPQPKDSAGKWRRERKNTRLPDYRPKDNHKMALRSQSFNERRAPAGPVARSHHYSDGELSDEVDDMPANLSVNGKAPPSYPGVKHEAPIDMRLKARPPPPYSRPSVITRSADTPPGSMSMCDPVIDEHFRRSLGDDYMNLFKKNGQPADTPAPSKPNMKDRASSPIQFNQVDSPKPTKIIAMEVDDASLSVDDHFAKALGDTWKQIQTSRQKTSDADKKPTQVTTKTVVDDHFSKALGDTWKKIQSSTRNLSPKSPEDKVKEQSTKIISRSGVVI